MTDRFPQLRGVKVTHAWIGNVAFTIATCAKRTQSIQRIDVTEYKGGSGGGDQRPSVIFAKIGDRTDGVL
jgi:hypothetical protein